MCGGKGGKVNIASYVSSFSHTYLHHFLYLSVVMVCGVCGVCGDCGVCVWWCVDVEWIFFIILFLGE